MRQESPRHLGVARRLSTLNIACGVSHVAVTSGGDERTHALKLSLGSLRSRVQLLRRAQGCVPGRPGNRASHIPYTVRACVRVYTAYPDCDYSHAMIGVICPP